MTSFQTPLVVEGMTGHLAVPILAIPAITIAAFTHFRSELPEFCIENAEKVMIISGLLTLILVGLAWFRKSRRIECAAGRLRYRSWITDKAVAISQISAATFETEVSGSGDQTVTEHYLSLWSGDEPVLRFNSQLWPREGMAAILRALQVHNPALRLDRAVERYAGQKA